MRLLATAALLAAASVLGGCSFTVDGIYLLRSRRRSIDGNGAPVLAEGVVGWRQIALDPDAGLVCHDITRPRIRWAKTATRIDLQSGDGALMPVAVFSELLLTAIIAFAVRGDDLAAVDTWWLVPVGLDLAWGTYRSLTIRPAILRETSVRWLPPETGDELVGTRTPCPPGTEIELVGDGESATFLIQEGGKLVEGEYEDLLHFLERHGRVKLAGEGRLDVSCRGKSAWTVRPPKGWPASSPHLGSIDERCPP